jgi:hypothetical protein
MDLGARHERIMGRLTLTFEISMQVGSMDVYAQAAVDEAGDIVTAALDTEDTTKIHAAFDRLEFALDMQERALRWALCIVFGTSERAS